MRNGDTAPHPGVDSWGTVRLELLGPVRVRDGGAVLTPGGPKQRLVLSLLVADANRVVSTDRLVEGVWNGGAPSDPHASLRVYVSNLRRTLGDTDVAIEHRSGGYVLEVDPDRVDLHRFETLVERGVRLSAHEPDRAATLLRDALGLWRGRPFGELADEPALMTDVARYEELRLRALEGRIAADLALGEHERITSELRALVREHPLRERLHGQLVLALYRSGRQAEALDAYEATRRTLASEMGIDPSPSLQELHAKVLRQDPSLDQPPGSRVATLPALRTVRGYALLEAAGQGGLGAMFRARHTDHEADLAVEELTGGQVDDPSFVRRFDAEARRSAELDHPHLVTVVDHWREPGAAYLVWPWVAGGRLSVALERGPWRADRAVDLLGQAGAAVAYLHGRGLHHGAVSAGTVLLDQNDDARLIDAVAHRLAPGTDETGARTDLRQLGLLLFELLTGRTPGGDRRPLSDLRPDLPRTLDDVVDRATGDAEPAFGAPQDLIAAARQAIDGTTATADRSTDVRNPFKGLRAFAEADAGDFFGRRGLTQRLLDRLGDPEQRFLAVVGPSGSGKSSLVRAGIVPAVRAGELPGSRRWFVATIYPGEWPMAELERTLVELATDDPDEVAAILHAGADGLRRAVAAVLPNDGSELLLVIDQFEEVFSQARDDDREAFLDHLTTAVDHPTSRLRVVATVRADFYDHLLVHPELGGLVAERTAAVPALSVDELQRAVTQPVRNVGVSADPELVATVVNDVSDEPGALPLLQYALTELFEQRDGHLLTLEAYRDIGGVRGALVGRAEDLYRDLDDQGREACRQVFLRLIDVGEGTAETKRRVLRSELRGAADTDTVERVLESFGAHRLVTFDRDPFSRAPTVEVAHEALTRRWGRLRGWIDGAHDDIVMHRRLLAATDEWRLADRDTGYLLRDPKLDEFAEWAESSSVVLTERERGYLDQSLAARAERRAEEEARRERERRLERRSVRRLRALVAVLAIGTVAAVGLSVFALQQRDRARDQQATAERQRAAAQEQERIATARELAAAAIGELEQDPERSVLLAIEAVEVTRETDGRVLPEAEAALHRAVRASRTERVHQVGGGVALASDGTLAMTGMDGALSVRDADGEVLFERADRPAHPLMLPGNNAPTIFLERTADLDLSPDGSLLATADGGFNAQVLDARTGELRVELDRRAIRPVFSPDGATIAAVLVQEGTEAQWDAGRTLGLWDADTGELIRLLEGHRKSVLDHAFSPDGTKLASVAPSGNSVRVWDAGTGHTLAEADRAKAKAVAFSPDGTLLAVGGGDGQAEIRDAAALDVLQPLRGHEGDLFAVAFSPDGQRVAVGGHGAQLFDARTGEEILALAGHGFSIADVGFSADGTRLVTSAEDDTTRIWDVAHPGGREIVTLPGPPPPARGALTFSPDGEVLAAAGPDGLRLWDTTTWEAVRTLPIERPAIGEVTFSRDGARIAASTFVPPPEGTEGVLVVWDATTGERSLEVPDHGGMIWDLAFSPDGELIATGTDNEGVVRVLDASSGALRASYRLEEGSVTSVEFTADGERLFVGGQDAGYLVDPAAGEELLAFDEADESILDDRIIADGLLVTGDIAGRVQVWDLEDGTVQATLTHHRQGIGAVAVRGGLVAAATPAAVDLLDLDTGERRFELATGHERGAVDLSFSPDGHQLATAGADGTVRLFAMRIDDLLRLARDRLTRTFTEAECQEFLHVPACPV